MRRECRSESYNQEFHDCLATANGLIDVIRCKDLYYQDVHFCEDECGEAPSFPIIRDIEFQMKLVLADIPFHPILSIEEDIIKHETSKWIFTENDNIIDEWHEYDDNCLDVPNLEEEISGKNYCVQWNITIYYDRPDGTQGICLFDSRYCIIIG